MDIEKMFAEAAAAAEDTGEKNVGGKAQAQAAPTQQAGPAQPATQVDNSAEIAKQEAARKAAEAKQAADEAARQETARKAAEAKQAADEAARQETARKAAEAKVQQERQAAEAARIAAEKKAEEERQAAEAAKRSAIAAASNVGLSESSIRKVLEMSKTLEKFDDKQKNFVSGYFQLDGPEASDFSKVIFKALTSSQRDLDAISKIVTSRSLDAAERAFFLMGLENMVIEDIYEQLDILTGGLGEGGKVNDSNKLAVCRKIESVISSMQKDIFTYIEKLQEFTNIAISE